MKKQTSYIVEIEIEAIDRATAAAIVEATGHTVLRVKNKPRTDKQNRALHLFFTMLSEELNEKGLDQWAILDQAKNLPWTKDSVKDNLWRKVQIALYPEKKSTTKICTNEIDKIYECTMWAINQTEEAKKIGGVHVPFPSDEELRIKSL